VKLVPAIAPEPPASEPPSAGFEMPSHFRSARLKAAWNDLVQNTDATLHVKQNRFTFEFAATLMAKFRGGAPMTATESKELKRLLVALGLAKNDDDQGKRKPRKSDDYFS
jgi:hypothetical protein